MTMRVVTTAARVPRHLPRPVVAIGTFDGVHRAHAAILRRVVADARRCHGTSVVLSFDPHPQHVLRPGREPRLLTRVDQRLEHFAALGVQFVWLVRFTRRFAQLTPDAFVQRLLVRTLHARAIVVGSSFGFGQGRTGTVHALRALGRRAGIRVRQVPDVLDGGAPITSSRIRAAIVAGRVREAARWLGRPVMLRGRVVRGAGRGRALGFPTANIDAGRSILPPDGVYVVRVQCGARWWRGVANIGRRPTFRDTASTTVEVHLLQFDGRLYGRSVTVEWLHRRRPEQAFATTADLRRQIAADIDEAQRYFRRQPSFMSLAPARNSQ